MSLRKAAFLAVVAALCLQHALADDLKPICPDRPGRGTSPCTVDPGRAQLELGLFDESFQRRSGVTTDAGNTGSLLAKWGVSESLDLEAGMALYQFQRVHDAVGISTASGTGDLFLHAKYQVLTTDGALALSLDPFVKLPTAGTRLGNGAVEGGVVAPMSYDLGSSWTFSMTPEVDVLLNDSGGGTHANLVDVVGLARSFGPLSLGTEIWSSQNLLPSGTVSQVSFDLFAAWLMNNDTQLDFGENLGLNRATPDLEIYVGISRRF
jgi:hypothetical protein